MYHENQGNYGYLRITLMLRKSEIINHKKVKRIMQQLDLKGNANGDDIVRITVKLAKL
ncbi:IS3 family transposase [Pasteurella bettyae]|uniref:IS3 family transposase n=1 Tax=Pasteurella bettyae TaxID=752 RepID=UPI0009D9A4A2